MLKIIILLWFLLRLTFIIVIFDTEGIMKIICLVFLGTGCENRKVDQVRYFINEVLMCAHITL